MADWGFSFLEPYFVGESPGTPFREGDSVSDFESVFEDNERWIESRTTNDHFDFDRLTNRQDPDIFFVGCSDSRVPPTVITGLEPGALFVHRNVANLVLPSDLNFLACLEYAVKGLEVDHVVVCGHYGCGGINACYEETGLKYVEEWIQEVRRIKRAHAEELEAIEDSSERVDRLSELNVEAQVENLSRTNIVNDAWESGHELRIHGWMYELESGRIVDQKITEAGPENRPY